MLLTVDEDLGLGLQRVLLLQSPVPDGAPERGPIVGLGRHQAQDGSGGLVPVLTPEDGRIQELGCSDSVPLDLRRRRAALGGAGQVELAAFRRRRR